MALVHLGTILYSLYVFVCACEKLPSIEILWDSFIEEEMRLEMVSASDEDVPELDLIGRVRKGGNKIGFVKG